MRKVDSPNSNPTPCFPQNKKEHRGKLKNDQKHVQELPNGLFAFLCLLSGVFMGGCVLVGLWLCILLKAETNTHIGTKQNKLTQLFTQYKSISSASLSHSVSQERRIVGGCRHSCPRVVMVIVNDAQPPTGETGSSPNGMSLPIKKQGKPVLIVLA